MMALTTEQQKMKEAALAATPGPWTWVDNMAEDSYKMAEMRSACGTTVFEFGDDTPDSELCGTEPDSDDATFMKLANPAAILAILAQLEQVQGWVSVDAEQKPTGRKPILVAVSCIKFGEHEDGTPGEGHSRVVTEGEYIPKHGDSGDYFTAYASPMADQEWITHWREIPPPPEAA